MPMFSVLLKKAERECLAGVGRRDRDGRKEALARARERAETEAMGLLEIGLRDRDARQAAADELWTALVDGRSDALEEAVAATLTARGLQVVVTSAARGTVDLDLNLPGEEHVPTHWPSTTATGLPSLKKLTKTEFAQQLRQLAAARVLLAVKESFAQSSNVAQVSVTGHLPDNKPILRATITRHAIESASWPSDAWSVLAGCDPDLEINVGGRTQEMRPLSSRTR